MVAEWDSFIGVECDMGIGGQWYRGWKDPDSRATG